MRFSVNLKLNNCLYLKIKNQEMLKKFNLFLFLLIGLFGYSQELNSEAQAIREKQPDFYNKILNYSKDEWGNNHEMVLYTINNQSKALFEVSKITNSNNYNNSVFKDALQEWTEDGLTNWEMVLYTYKKQIKAKSAYEALTINNENNEVITNDRYDEYLNEISKTIKNSNPQVFSNIVQLVISQNAEGNIKVVGKAINKQIKAMSNLSNPMGDNNYSQEAMTMALSRNMQMQDGQALIDYVGTLNTYKEIIKEGQIKIND